MISAIDPEDRQNFLILCTFNRSRFIVHTTKRFQALEGSIGWSTHDKPFVAIASTVGIIDWANFVESRLPKA